MLIRAAVIYTLLVVCTLLGAVIVWQRAAVGSLSAEAVMAENMAADLRTQLDSARANTGETERELRLVRQALDDEQRRRAEADRAAASVRAELDRQRGASQTATEVRKAADDEIAHHKQELDASARSDNDLRAKLTAARAEADAANAELETLRRQLPLAATAPAPGHQTSGTMEPTAANPGGGAAPAVPDSSSARSKSPASANAEPARERRTYAGRRPARRHVPVSPGGQFPDLLLPAE
jgi:hypothetical protein